MSLIKYILIFTLCHHCLIKVVFLLHYIISIKEIKKKENIGTEQLQ